MIYLGQHEPESCQALHQTLSGWRMRTFSDGQELYQALQQGDPPGLLLLDLLLPGMDPFLMIRLLKFDARFAQMPVLCLTPYSEPGLPDRLHRLGARGWLPPDGDPRLLLEAVAALLGETSEPPMRLAMPNLAKGGTPALRVNGGGSPVGKAVAPSSPRRVPQGRNEDAGVGGGPATG